MELTEEQSMAMDFIGQVTNEVTRNGNSDLWKDNIIRNRKHFRIQNQEVNGLAVYVVCAGPSLDKNINELKNISKRGTILVVDAALRFVIKKGIKPEYCIMIDGSKKMLKMMEGVDTKGITLVCTAAACPDVVEKWKGPKYFVSTPHFGADRKFNNHHYTRIVKAKGDIKKGDELVLNEHYEVEFEGVNTMIISGGNVSTAAHHFAFQQLRANKVVFIGLDLSWKYESHHYAGHEHQENVYDRTKTGVGEHIDSNDDKVFTNLSMMSFKRWHETFSKSSKGSVVNATEGGILGIDQNGEKADYIEFLTLREAINKYTPMESLGDPLLRKSVTGI